MSTRAAQKDRRPSGQFNIRLAAESREKIERAALVQRQTLTEFAEAAMLERAEAVLERQEQILLSDRDFKRFVQMMSEETEPTEQASREAAEFREGHREGGRYRW